MYQGDYGARHTDAFSDPIIQTTANVEKKFGGSVVYILLRKSCKYGEKKLLQ